jgi:hypothetical protein
MHILFHTHILQASHLQPGVRVPEGYAKTFKGGAQKHLTGYLKFKNRLLND